MTTGGGGTASAAARLVVGADGAMSAVRRLAFGDRSAPARYAAVQAAFAGVTRTPFYGAVFDPSLTDFYGWTIPKGGVTLAGIAVPAGQGARETFESFVTQARAAGLCAGDELYRQAATIARPRRVSDLLCGERGVALVGEAAGFVSPSSGEGISFALRSARLLAEALEPGLDGAVGAVRRLGAEHQTRHLAANREISGHLLAAKPAPSHAQRDRCHARCRPTPRRAFGGRTRLGSESRVGIPRTPDAVDVACGIRPSARVHWLSSDPIHRGGPLMRSESLTFLRELVEAPSPSGYEQPAARVFRDYMAPFADELETDVMGSVHATLRGSAAQRKDGERTSIMLAGHIDEIGMMVTYVMDSGFIAFKSIGGIDEAVLPGMRVRVHTKDGVLLGLLGRLPIHLLEDEERKSVTKMHKLFIDLGLPVEKVKATVRIGDPITFGVGFEHFGDGMAVSRAFDDKMGAWICAEVLREVKKKGGAKVDLVAAATVQEEVGLRGGTTSAYGVNPTVGIAVEVGHATDYPDVDKRKHGEADCGKGPIIARGPNINPVVFDLLVKAAEKAKVPHQFGGEPRGTGTDANAIQLSRGGKAAALLSVPLRYMHTPNEVLALADLESSVKLLAEFVRSLDPKTDFTP